MASTSSTQLRLPAEMMEEIKAMAEANERSINWQLTHLIKLGMDKEGAGGLTMEDIEKAVENVMSRAGGNA